MDRIWGNVVGIELTHHEHHDKLGFLQSWNIALAIAMGNTMIIHRGTFLDHFGCEEWYQGDP